MVQTSHDLPPALREGKTLFGPGWKAVDNFDDLSDIDEYESDDEETYVTLDLGAAVEPRSLLTETDYQLIGLDTPLPFLKLNNQIYQGDVASLVGDEVILGLKRNHENPHNPSHPPVYSTNKRIIFHPVTLKPRAEKTTEEPASLSRHAEKMRKRVLGAPNLRGRTKKDDKGSPSGSRTGSATPTVVDFTLGADDAPTSMENEAGPSTVRGEGDLPPTVRTNAASALPSPAPAAMTGLPSAPAHDAPTDLDQPYAGPSTPMLADPKKKSGRKKLTQDIVINALSEWHALDASAAPVKAKIILSPGVDLSQIGPGLKDDQRILSLAEVIKIKSGIPLSGKGSRGPRKPKDKEKAEESTDGEVLGEQPPGKETAGGVQAAGADSAADTGHSGGPGASEVTANAETAAPAATGPREPGEPGAERAGS